MYKVLILFDKYRLLLAAGKKRHVKTAGYVDHVNTLTPCVRVDRGIGWLSVEIVTGHENCRILYWNFRALHRV
jgi:hypothetical protein